MQDVFAYCSDLVRTADPDRFIASLFAPADKRLALHSLYAFNVEMARVREVIREPLAGEIRLQWWTEFLRGERAVEAEAHPIAAALHTTIEQSRLPAAPLFDLIEARRFDLYGEPMESVADLEDYARKTASGLFTLAASVLGGSGLETVSGPAGMAYAIAGLSRAMPIHAARGQLFVPTEILARHGVATRDVFGGHSSQALRTALAELRQIARKCLVDVGARLDAVPGETLPAFLPLAPVGPTLDRLERSDPFAPAELSRWRRQWLIWRAARKPARIAG